MKRLFSTLPFIFFSVVALAQSGAWQQRVNYKMEVDMNVNTNRFTGTQRLDYWNNSPDTLRRVFFIFTLMPFVRKV